jgi:lipopolysaccharide export system protein LptC
MKQRLYDRFAAVLSVLLLAGLAATTYYLAELSSILRGPPAARRVTHEPDYFIEQFALTRMNLRGEPVFRMSAARLVHFPDDDSSEFTSPVLVSLDPARPLVTLRAERGRSTRDGEQTHLHDHVVMTRAPVGDRPELQVRTDYVLVLPNEDVARTDRPVAITYGASSLTGVGMEFNNAARVLNVRSQVRGVWAAPARN